MTEHSVERVYGGSVYAHLQQLHGIVMPPNMPVAEVAKYHNDLHGHPTPSQPEPEPEPEIRTGNIVEVWTGHRWQDGRVYEPKIMCGVPGHMVGVFGETGTRWFGPMQIRTPQPATDVEPRLDHWEVTITARAIMNVGPPRQVIIRSGTGMSPMHVALGVLSEMEMPDR